MKRAFVSIAKTAFNLIYKYESHKNKRENLVVFFSRQTNDPSYDFDVLAHEFESRGWSAIMHLKKVTRKTLLPYTKHVFKELQLLASCKVAILDRYDPVISLLDLECETIDTTNNTQNQEFPILPFVLQLWHAFGAFKKFGYQSSDTTEGHSSEFSSIFNIHRNYSWIVCSGEQTRAAFAEAFSYPIERVIPLNRPEFDELLNLRNETASEASAKEDPLPNVLMAPTLRKNKASAHPFRNLHQHRSQFENNVEASIIWSFHPLEEKLPAPGNVSESLVTCDIVVTDYSSIAYEAYALGKMVLFYVPDIESYRVSPGLNADPFEICPDICLMTENELTEALNMYSINPESYPYDQLSTFAASAFDELTDDRTTAARIVDFVFKQLGK